MLVKNKIRTNMIVYGLVGIGLIVCEIIVLMLWVLAFLPAGVFTSTLTYFTDLRVLVPVGFSVFFSFLFGAWIRGLEKKSIGIELDGMDETELDETIKMLEKIKRINFAPKAPKQIGPG